MSKTEILELLPKLGKEERREILERLCDLEDADSTEFHQDLVEQALRSGPAAAATPANWDGSLQRGLERGKKA